MRFKPTVDPRRVQPETLVGMLAVDHAFRTVGHELTITSVSDGAHGPKSLHRFGLAFDFRTNDLTDADLGHLKLLVSRCLPDGYDVVWEHDHGHCEYDP